MEIQCDENTLLIFYHFITMPFPKNFTPPFTQSQVNINTNINVNIILFQKKRYFNLFLQLRIFT